MANIWEKFKGRKKEDLEPAEGVVEEFPLLSLDVDDKELVSRVDKAIQSGTPLYKSALNRAEINRKYWKAEHLDLKKLKDYQAKVVNNIVFRDMETMLPIITRNTPLANFISSNKDFDRSMEKLMLTRWEVVDNMLDKNRSAARANFLDLLGVLKYRYDADVDEVEWEFVKTRNVVISPDAPTPGDIDFVAEYIRDQSISDIVERFPKAKEELFKKLEIKTETDEKLGSRLTYVEFWTPDFVIWKYHDIVFDKYKNPNYDWGIDKETNDRGKEKEKQSNLFKKPRVPYIFLSTFTLGEHLYSDTSLVEQTIALQDGANKRKRQISDNADEANGILVGSGDYIDKTEFSKLDNEPNLKVWVGKGNAGEALVRIPGNPLQGYVFNDMVHSERAMDDIWGIHSITRGAPGDSDTATAKVLQQKQDFGRIDDIVKASKYSS